MQKPTILVPEWCTTSDLFNAPGKAWDGQTRKVDPGSSVEQGYFPATKPPVTEYNYQLNAIGQWLRYYETLAMRTWVPAGFRPFSWGQTSGEVLTIGYCPASNEYLYTLNVNRSLMLFSGPNLGEVVDKSHTIGIDFPAHHIANDDTNTLIVADPPGGGSASVLQYNGSVVTLKGTISSVTEDFTKGDFIYDPISDLWVIVGDNSTKGIIFTSGDSGANWVQRTTTTSANYVDGLKSIAVSSSGFFVAVEGHSTGTDSFTSPDGINWTKHDNIGPTPSEIIHGNNITYDASTGYFILVTEDTDQKTFISSNGTTWVAMSDWGGDTLDHTVINVRAFNGAWVIVSRTTPSKSHMYLSVDQGQSWEKLGNVPIIQSGSTLYPPTAFEHVNGLALIASGNLSDTVHFTRGLTA